MNIDKQIAEAIAHLEKARKLAGKPIKTLDLADMEARFANLFAEQFKKNDKENPRLAQGRANYLFAMFMKEIFDIPEEEGADSWEIEVQFTATKTNRRIYVGPQGHYVKKINR